MGVHPRFRPRFQPNHPKVKAIVFWYVLESAKKPSKAKEQAFLLCSILGSVLGFSLIILNGQAHKYHFWWFEIHNKRRETKTQIILGFILRVGWKKILGWFREFHPNHPRDVYHYALNLCGYSSNLVGSIWGQLWGPTSTRIGDLNKKTGSQGSSDSLQL